MKQTYFDYDSRAIINLDYWWDGPGIVLSRVNTPEASRGKGIMRKLMAELFADANREQVRLSLWINAYGPMDRKQLAAWYRRLGFMETSWNGESGLFVRMPVISVWATCGLCGRQEEYHA